MVAKMYDNRRRLLIVHSSAELYGSDKSLLDFVVRKSSEFKITVVLPESGILIRYLEQAGSAVAVGEICKIQRSMMSPIGVLRTIIVLFRAIRFLGKLHLDDRFELVYSNNLAILGGGICAYIWGIPHVWHVREILDQSILVSTLFRSIVRALSTSVICNSNQTLEWISKKRSESLNNKYVAIWNGYDSMERVSDRMAERRKMNITDDDILFVLVGRINAWKGQKLLLEAFCRVVASGEKLARLAFVGSAYTGHECYENELRSAIGNSGSSEFISLQGFRVDIESIWDASDIVVVPSTEPEPFGRVAIEAMAFGKPVIAASHGGLVDIVQDGVTGLLVPPRNAKALASAMQTLIHDSRLRKNMGDAGRARQRSCFSAQSYADAVSTQLKAHISMSDVSSVQ